MIVISKLFSSGKHGEVAGAYTNSVMSLEITSAAKYCVPVPPVAVQYSFPTLNAGNA